jgi:hypothetical protein
MEEMKGQQRKRWSDNGRDENGKDYTTNRRRKKQQHTKQTKTTRESQAEKKILILVRRREVIEPRKASWSQSKNNEEMS